MAVERQLSREGTPVETSDFYDQLERIFASGVLGFAQVIEPSDRSFDITPIPRIIGNRKYSLHIPELLKATVSIYPKIGDFHIYPYTPDEEGRLVHERRDRIDISPEEPIYAIVGISEIDLEMKLFEVIRLISEKKTPLKSEKVLKEKDLVAA
ncbi:hypothetical protein HYT33_01545 [Candidatus Roizmanbacteria bacterium]|nr:hypothetical protein [Candidatus Roizmanbacteria bacterium]